MSLQKRVGVPAIAIALALAGCMGDARDEDMGTMSMDLQIAPGVTINTLNWTISNPNGFSRTGSVWITLESFLSRKETSPGPISCSTT